MTEKNKEDKKEHILSIAEKVFAELGYEGASTRHLAQEAGVNMAMINYYFGSKDGLMKAVLERRITGMRNSLVEVKELNIPSWEKLKQAIDLYLDRVMENNSFHRIIYREVSLTQRSDMADFISDNILKNINALKDIVEEGIQNGAFRHVDVEMVIASILGTKYFIVNSPQISSRLLKKDFQDQDVMEKEIKLRIKKFVHEYLQAFLLNNDPQN
ncbi:TetR/AcrR family transcriptional regulator [Pontibacter silvestris]|uniref:TetR/AcrR family transcriptional regulator n=1 Tax=Pontibacter silvestris TaxID=2305183 RepID=A0ABW4X380_9BACT|nr:TetR/AcrR family transcriptional regulator [Pontibacter silvestris]MCC9136010.1 TetR/AcrR family transcriptional regulator [Pontibacter silvestris]